MCGCCCTEHTHTDAMSATLFWLCCFFMNRIDISRSGLRSGLRSDQIRSQIRPDQVSDQTGSGLTSQVGPPDALNASFRGSLLPAGIQNHRLALKWSSASICSNWPISDRRSTTSEGLEWMNEWCRIILHPAAASSHLFSCSVMRVLIHVSWSHSPFFLAENKN